MPKLTPAAITAAVTPGVTERPYVPGWTYHAFVVHPANHGTVTLAIAHAEGHKLVSDLVQDGLTVPEAAILVKRYGIDKVTGAVSEGADGDLAHAVCGAVVCADRGRYK